MKFFIKKFKKSNKRNCDNNTQCYYKLIAETKNFKFYCIDNDIYYITLPHFPSIRHYNENIAKNIKDEFRELCDNAYLKLNNVFSENTVIYHRQINKLNVADNDNTWGSILINILQRSKIILNDHAITTSFFSSANYGKEEKNILIVVSNKLPLEDRIKKLILYKEEKK